MLLKPATTWLCYSRSPKQRPYPPFSPTELRPTHCSTKSRQLAPRRWKSSTTSEIKSDQNPTEPGEPSTRLDRSLLQSPHRLACLPPGRLAAWPPRIVAAGPVPADGRARPYRSWQDLHHPSAL